MIEVSFTMFSTSQIDNIEDSHASIISWVIVLDSIKIHINSFFWRLAIQATKDKEHGLGLRNANNVPTL